MTTDELGATLRRRADIMRWRAHERRVDPRRLRIAREAAREKARCEWARLQAGRAPSGGTHVDRTHGRTA